MSASPVPAPPAHAQIQPRRGFLAKFGAVLVGGLVGVFPFMAGLVAFCDPLRRGKGEVQAIRLATLDSLPDDGVPRPFPVISDRQDAWTHYPPEPMGAVYLIREPGQSTVRALNATCPHAGCFVGYLATKKYFRCPCHTSAFDLEGHILSDVSRVPHATWTCWNAKCARWAERARFGSNSRTSKRASKRRFAKHEGIVELAGSSHGHPEFLARSPV